MSQRDLVAELRAAHVDAPPEVRERVRLIAAGAPAPPRRITWRRSLVQEGMAKPAQLGTITDENVSTVDQTALLNTPARAIARLQKQVATLRTEPRSDENDRRIAALVTRIERLQRGEATTRRNAHF